MKTTFKTTFKSQIRRKMKLTTSLLAIALTAAITLLYQNCTAPIASGTKTVDAQAASLPFAYDAQVDQIAYMSCSELTSADTSQYFMIRAGAYGNGAGLAMTSDFLNKTQGNYVTERSQLLNSGTMNSGTKLMFSMRNNGDFESIYPPTNTVNVDWTPVFADLGVDQTTSDALVATTNAAAGSAASRLRFVSTGQLPAARFEGDLEGGLGANQYAQYRSYFTNSQILFGINYMSASGQSFARAPADYPTTTGGLTTAQSIFGHGLYLKFGFPSVTGLAASMPNYTLSEVDEYDMQNRAVVGTWGTGSNATWQCPKTLQLRIVRPEDLAVAGVNCKVVSDSNTTYNGNAALLKKVRNSLRTEDWYVDLADQCIVAKKVTGGQCYGATANLRVEYNEANTCIPSATTGSVADPSTCGALNSDGTVNYNSPTCVYVNKTCVHYASICYR